MDKKMYRLTVELTESEWGELKVALDWLKETTMYFEGKLSDRYVEIEKLEEKIFKGLTYQGHDITEDDLPF